MAVLKETGLQHLCNHINSQITILEGNMTCCPRKATGNPIIFENGIENFRVSAKIINEFERPTSNGGEETIIENWPTPDSPADIPVKKTNYFIYSGINNNMFNKDALNYGVNESGTAVASMAISNKIYIPTQGELFINLFNVPDTVSISCIVCDRASDGIYSYGSVDIMESGSPYVSYGDWGLGGVVDSIIISISKLDESELTSSDLAELRVGVYATYDPEELTFEAGKGNFISIDVDSAWDASAGYFGIVDLNQGIIEMNYGVVMLSDLVAETVTWTKNTTATPTGDSISYWSTSDIQIDDYDSDLFCTHYSTNSIGSYGLDYDGDTLSIYNATDFATEDEFKAFVGSLSGMIIYKRTEPLIYQISTPNIYCYEGSNYLYADGNIIESIYNIPDTAYKFGTSLPANGKKGDVFFLLTA